MSFPAYTGSLPGISRMSTRSTHKALPSNSSRQGALSQPLRIPPPPPLPPVKTAQPSSVQHPRQPVRVYSFPFAGICSNILTYLSIDAAAPTTTSAAVQRPTTSPAQTSTTSGEASGGVLSSNSNAAGLSVSGGVVGILVAVLAASLASLGQF